MPPKPVPPNAPAVLSRDAKITALSLLKNYYDEETFTLLVKEIYNADLDISIAAIRASGSLGNEVAVQHLYQMVERGKPPQKIAAVQSLMAIRAPSSVGMLVKYFNHFPDEDLRAEILRAINTISPSAQQVLELNNAAFGDARQGESVKSVAAESLVESERYALLRDALPRALPGVQQAAFAKMLQTGSQEVIDLPMETLAPSALGCFLCVYTLKARNPQANLILETLQKSERETLYAFLHSLSDFQGRLRFPTRVFRLLLVTPYVDSETESMVGDFLRKIVLEVKTASPHLLSEFSMVASAHIDNVFAKIRKNYISLQGIANKDVLLATVLATLLEKHSTAPVLADVLAYFKEDGYSGATPPVSGIRSLLAEAPKEDQNRFEACMPLFALKEKTDRYMVLQQILRVDLNRPFSLRRLNRLIRVAGALEIKTTSKKIQEILDFARKERIHFLEETSIVTLCQLLTRSIIEQSREYFREPSRNLRSLNGYIRGARFIPPRILVTALIHIVQHHSLAAASRILVIETLEAMNLQGMQRSLQPLLKVLDLKEFPPELMVRIGDIVARYADPTFAHVALDLAAHPSPVGRRVAVRIVKALAARGAGAPADIVTNRLYLLLEDADRGVRVDALLALLSMGDDYASQIVADYINAGDGQIVSEIITGLERPLRRETFALVVDAIRMSSLPVQEALRALLPELSQGGFAEELKQGLMRALSQLPAEGQKAETAPAREEDLSAPSESTLGQAKLEFKFRRESMLNATVFFIDIAGYTEKSQALKSTELMTLIKAFEDIVVSVIDEYQGRIVKKMGDGILAYFKSPVGATAAALSVQRKIGEYSAMRVEQEKFQTRIGLNTGSIIRKGKDIFGEVVNVAARMQSAATPGDILLTDATYQEVREHVRCTELGKIQAKGIKDAITAYSPQELTADPAKILTAAPDAGLRQLKESIFVPSFQVPPGAAGQKLAGLLREVFSEVSRAIEELAADYHDEYEFKKYLQEKWNSLMENL
jgi:class 3 adenylate cyclase/HEAT repeat protein